MTHIFIKKVQTGSKEGVYRSTSRSTFFDNVTIVPMEDIMPVKGPHIKFYNQVFNWPTLFKDARRYVLSCEKCQRVGNISRRNEMPMNYSLVIEPFDCWGFDFMGPFPPSHKYTHILVVVDYVTKWVEAIPTESADHKTSLKMLTDVIFPRFGVPRYLMTDGGSHFTHGAFRKSLAKYDVNHRTSSP